MSNMRIIEIPASMRENAGRKNTVRKLRVAAYCRVSTEEEEQQGSFEIQKLYYTEKINSTPEWEVAGIYADDGISGVHTKKRDGFNQMIQDCKKRKIDLILTKSISRFARNTLDSIQYVRMLKQMGIAVVFEKENINTATMNSEMILTVLSAFAQAESESISQNVARGKRMGYISSGAAPGWRPLSWIFTGCCKCSPTRRHAVWRWRRSCSLPARSIPLRSPQT